MLRCKSPHPTPENGAGDAPVTSIGLKCFFFFFSEQTFIIYEIICCFIQNENRQMRKTICLNRSVHNNIINQYTRAHAANASRQHCNDAAIYYDNFVFILCRQTCANNIWNLFFFSLIALGILYLNVIQKPCSQKKKKST